MHTTFPLGHRLRPFQRIIRATYLELLLSWILINVAFTAGYFLLSLYHPEHGLNLPVSLTLGERLYDSLYFSFATATTVGYGDILPLGISKILAVLQASVGVMVFTVFVGKMVSEGDKR